MTGFAKLRVRPMTTEDITGCMALVRAASWNQTELDWQRFLEQDHAGCFVAESEGIVCGTTTTIVYAEQLAWLGMVLVSPDLRGRGIGTELVRLALEYLDSRGPLTIGLDATPQGKSVYKRFGFEPEYEIERWVLTAAAAPPPWYRAERQEGATAGLESIVAMDAEIFGASRRALLHSLHRAASEFTAVISANGTLQGYTLGRHGLLADHLGPWVAKDQQIARELLSRFLTHAARKHVIADCFTSHPFALELLRAAGFQYSRPLTRMIRGRDRRHGRIELLCAILGPEFG